MAQWKRVTVYALGLTGWFGFNAVMAFYTYLWRNSPDRPDFAAGRIAPMYRHRRIFFVEAWERSLSFYGLLLSLALVGLAAILAVAFFRRDIASGRRLFWLNASALAVFFGWFAYAAWPPPF